MAGKKLRWIGCISVSKKIILLTSHMLKQVTINTSMLCVFWVLFGFFWGGVVWCCCFGVGRLVGWWFRHSLVDRNTLFSFFGCKDSLAVFHLPL